MRHYCLPVITYAASGSFPVSDALTTLLVLGAVIVGLSLALGSKAPDTPAWARSKAVNSVRIRRDANAKFVHGRRFLFRPRMWFMGTGCPPVRIPTEHFTRAAQSRHSVPVECSHNYLSPEIVGARAHHLDRRTRRWPTLHTPTVRRSSTAVPRLRASTITEVVQSDVVECCDLQA